MINASEATAGWVRKAITPSDVHTNAPLTNVSLGYMQSTDEFISDKIFPQISVTHQSDTYAFYPPGDWNRDDMKKRAPATETAGTGYDIQWKTYFAHVWGVHRDIDDQLRANADSIFNLDAEATAFVTRKGLIRREVDFATRFFGPGIWTALKTGVVSAPTANQFLQWNDAASEPSRDVKQWSTEMALRTGVRPNVLVLGHQTYDTLTENDSVIDRIKYGQTPGSPAMVTKQALAALFGIERIEVMSSIVNTAPEGATAVNAFLGSPKGALLLHAATSPGTMTPSAGYTFVWAGYNGASNYGTRIARFRMELIRSDRIELDMAFANEMVSDDMATYIAAAVA